MIIYSVMPPEWRLAGLEGVSQRFYDTIDGIPVELLPVGENKVQVFRIISTDPRDFLHPQLQPGRVLMYARREELLPNT